MTEQELREKMSRRWKELTDCLSWEWCQSDFWLDKVMVVIATPLFVVGWLVSLLPKMGWITK